MQDVSQVVSNLVSELITEDLEAMSVGDGKISLSSPSATSDMI